MSAAATKNFHLPLPIELYSDLRAAATRAGTPTTEVARTAIHAWLKEEGRRERRAALAAFVAANAGSVWDIDPQWESAGLASLATLAPWSDASTHEPLAVKPLSKPIRNHRKAIA